MISAALTGFFSGLSLIVAIGAQNVFILRQSLTRNHIFVVCMFCAVSDSLLVIAGVLGFGAVVGLYPSLPDILAVLGAGFLIVYGLIRLREVWRGSYHMELGGRPPTLRKILLTLLAVTWLNPHVYVDTMGLLGAISTQFDAVSDRVAFTVATALASFAFFFTLGYGGRFLAPYLQTVRAWRVLDVTVAVIMFALALNLLRSVGAH
jgi:L-lysine exporter family protein LysE/ArgO